MTFAAVLGPFYNIAAAALEEEGEEEKEEKEEKLGAPLLSLFGIL